LSANKRNAGRFQISGELLRHGDGTEVLEPQDLREKMRQMIAENLKRY
jgi:predicted DNA-binding transcriptional regulator YafY